MHSCGLAFLVLLSKCVRACVRECARVFVCVVWAWVCVLVCKLKYVSFM